MESTITELLTIAPWLIGLGAGIVGGVVQGSINSAGQRRANDQNKNLTREQMAFQERMSNTAHQRQRKDLEEAGLNPLLATNTGASSPQGNAATMQNANTGFQGLGETAMGAMRLKADLKNLKADTAKKKAEAKTTKQLGELHRTNKKGVEQNINIKSPVETMTNSIDNLQKILNWRMGTGSAPKKLKNFNTPKGGLR